MSASYFGTFPVKRETSNFVTLNGVRTATMSIVDKEADIAGNMPLSGSAYEYDSNLLVTQATITYQGNGLAEITVSASGPSGDPHARVALNPGSPLIYGLSPGIPPSANGIPQYSAGGGVSVEVTFCSSIDQRESLIATYYRQPMPSEILGITLPAPSRAPGPITGPEPFGDRTPFPNPFPDTPPGFEDQPSISGAYGGFNCTDLILQPEGSALVVRLIFKETGWLTDTRNGRTIFYYN